MARIFLSYSRKDTLAAIALQQWLVEQDDTLRYDIFRDKDSETGIHPGEKWREALRQASSRCEYVVCLGSQAWLESRMCRKEFEMAQDFGKRILLLRLEEFAPDQETGERHWIDLFDEPFTTIDVVHEGRPHEVRMSTGALEHLRKILVRRDNSPEEFVWPPAADRHRYPYRGDAPFEEIDAGVFYGREVEREVALSELHRMRAARQGIYVIRGQAGCGKSSFLQAGLFPRLRRDDRDFVVLDAVRNQRKPMSGSHGMAEVVCAATKRHDLDPISPTDLWHEFRGSPATLDAKLQRIHEAATKRLLHIAAGAEPPVFVLAIDQSDELFVSDSDDERQMFLELVAKYARDGAAGGIPVIVVVSLRSSHYPAFEKWATSSGVNTSVLDLEPIAPQKFAEVVEGPASRPTDRDRPLHVENKLVELLVKDSSPGADPLPLLSLTLARLWQAFGHDGDLRLVEYQRMGGMGAVIAREINDLLDEASGERAAKLALLRKAFIPHLVTVDPDTRLPAPRRAKLESIPPESMILINKFIDRRLLVARPDGSVELAADRILDDWAELGEWLDEVRSDLERAEALKREAAKWEDRGKDKDILLQGSQLEAAEAILESQFAEWLAPAGDFVRASRRRAAEKRRKARVLQIAAAVVLVVCMLGVVAIWQWRQSAQLARALELVTQAEQMLEGSIPGGDIRALQLLLAAHSLGVTNVEGVASQRNDLVRIIELPLAGAGNVVGVNDIAVSPDGNLIAAATVDHQVRMWHSQTGAPAAQLELNGNGKMHAVAFSESGDLIAAGGDDGILRVWNAASGAPQSFSGVPGQMITSVAFSPSGRSLAAGTSDGLLRLWDIESGELRSESTVVPERKAVRSVAFKPAPKLVAAERTERNGGDVLVTGDDFGRVQLWDGDTGRPLSGPVSVDANSSILSVAFGVVVNEAGEKYRLAVGMLDGRIHVLDAATLEPDGPAFSAHPGFVHKLAFSPGGTRIVSGGSDNSVRVWDATSHQPIGDPLLGHHGAVSSVAFDPEGTRIVSGGQDGSVRIWDAIGGLPLPAGQGSEVRAVAFRPGSSEAIERAGGQMASGGTDGTVKLWNPETGATIRQLGLATEQDLEDSINALAYSPTGDRLVTGSRRGKLELWHLDELPADKRVVPDSFARRAQAQDGARISSVAFSPDGKRIATGQWDGNVQLWDAHTLQPVRRATKLPYQVWSVAFSPRGDFVASGSGDAVDSDSPPPHEIRLWTADNMADTRAPLAGPSDSIIYSLSFNSAGDLITSGSADGAIQLWDVYTGQPAGPPLSGDQNTVMTLAFAHEGPLMASGSADGKVRLWDTATRQLVGTPISGHRKWVHSVAFSPQDDWVVSGGADGNLRLLPVLQDVPQSICDRIGASMTRDEWRDLVADNSLFDGAAIPYRDLCPQETGNG